MIGISLPGSRRLKVILQAQFHSAGGCRAGRQTIHERSGLPLIPLTVLYSRAARHGPLVDFGDGDKRVTIAVRNQVQRIRFLGLSDASTEVRLPRPLTLMVMGDAVSATQELWRYRRMR